MEYQIQSFGSDHYRTMSDMFYLVGNRKVFYMICFDNVSFQYTKDRESLKGINLTVNEGDVVLVCGPSGCGKSTLVRCVNGLIPHFYEGTMTGSVTVNGIDVSQTTLRKISRHVGTVFQNPRSQFFNVDTTSELAFGCENFGLDPDEIERRINRVVNVHGLAPLMDRSIFKLSGGEKQKIACASIAVEPLDVIILDEPFSGLDIITVDSLWEILLKLRDKGCTILFSTHNLFDNITKCDEFFILKKGHIIEEGNLEKIQERYNLILEIENETLREDMLAGIKGIRNFHKEDSIFHIEIENTEVAKSIYNVLEDKYCKRFYVRKFTLAEIFRKIGRGVTESE